MSLVCGSLQVSQVQVVVETVMLPQLQLVEKITVIPEVLKLFVQFLDKAVDLPVLVQVVCGRQKTVENPQLLSDRAREQIVASCHRSWRKSSRSSASSWTRLLTCPLLRGRRPCCAGRCRALRRRADRGVQCHRPWGNREGDTACAYRPMSLLCRSCRFLRCRL